MKRTIGLVECRACWSQWVSGLRKFRARVCAGRERLSTLHLLGPV